MQDDPLLVRFAARGVEELELRDARPGGSGPAGPAGLERVRTGGAELARTGDPATLAIDATADADTVAANIIAEVESRWPGFPYRD